MSSDNEKEEEHGTLGNLKNKFLKAFNKYDRPVVPVRDLRDEAEDAIIEEAPGLFQGIDYSSEAEQYKGQLTQQQFSVAYRHGVDPPWRNRHCWEKREGVYTSVASGEFLFSSKHKFNSGTGHPSFTEAVEGAPIEYNEVEVAGEKQTEVRCSTDKVRLGQVLEDGPESTGGLRYIINSSSLSFVLKEQLTSGQRAAFGLDSKSPSSNLSWEL